MGPDTGEYERRLALTSPGVVLLLDGRAYPLSRAGLVAALTDLPPTGGVVLQPPNCPFRFETAEPVLITSDNVSLIGHPSSVISGPLTGDCVMISPYGVRGPGQPLTRNAQRFATQVELAGALELEAGDTILISDDADQHSHISIVTDASDPARPSFADPLSDAFNAGPCYAYKLTMRRGLDVRLWLDGAGCTGSVVGFGANFTQFSRFDITATHFNTRNSGGAYDNYGYGNSLRGLFVDCGNANNALGYSSSALEIAYSTRATVRDTQIVSSRGFGFSASFTNHSLFDNVVRAGGVADTAFACAAAGLDADVVHGAGRNAKVCAAATFTAAADFHAVADGVGARDVVESDCIVENCGWHGVEIYEDNVHHISSTNLISQNNGLVNAGVDIATWGHDLAYTNASYATRADRAIATLWDGALSEGEVVTANQAGTTVVYRKTIAASLLSGGRGLHLYMAASVESPATREFKLTLRLGHSVLFAETLTAEPGGTPLIVDVRLQRDRSVVTATMAGAAARITTAEPGIEADSYPDLTVAVTFDGQDIQLQLDICQLECTG